jgi:hypothetical protein
MWGPAAPVEAGPERPLENESRRTYRPGCGAEEASAMDEVRQPPRPFPSRWPHDSVLPSSRGPLRSHAREVRWMKDVVGVASAREALSNPLSVMKSPSNSRGSGFSPAPSPGLSTAGDTPQPDSVALSVKIFRRAVTKARLEGWILTNPAARVRKRPDDPQASDLASVAATLSLRDDRRMIAGLVRLAEWIHRCHCRV